MKGQTSTTSFYYRPRPALARKDCNSSASADGELRNWAAEHFDKINDPDEPIETGGLVE